MINKMERGIQHIYKLALSLIKNKQYLNARDVTRQLIKLDPENAYAYNILGVIQEYYFEDAEGAKHYYSKALNIDNNNIRFNVNFARVLFALGELDELDALTQKLQQIKGIAKHRIFWLQSSLLELKQEFKEAHRLIQEAIKITTNNKDLKEMLETTKRLEMKLKVFSPELV